MTALIPATPIRPPYGRSISTAWVARGRWPETAAASASSAQSVRVDQYVGGSSGIGLRSSSGGTSSDRPARVSSRCGGGGRAVVVAESVQGLVGHRRQGLGVPQRREHRGRRCVHVLHGYGDQRRRLGEHLVVARHRLPVAAQAGQAHPHPVQAEVHVRQPEPVRQPPGLLAGGQPVLAAAELEGVDGERGEQHRLGGLSPTSRAAARPSLIQAIRCSVSCGVHPAIHAARDAHHSRCGSPSRRAMAIPVSSSACRSASVPGT